MVPALAECNQASGALRSLGVDKHRARALLDAAKKDPSPSVKYWAALALGDIGDARALNPLIDLLKDSEPGPRRGAAMALGYLGKRSAVGPLITSLKDSDYWVRSSAARSFGSGSSLRPDCASSTNSM